MTQKGNKNLQFAKDLNAEIELMFADDDFKIKPSKSKLKRKEVKQKQVSFASAKTLMSSNESGNLL